MNRLLLITLFILVIISPVFAGDMLLDHAVIHHTASPDWSVNKIRRMHIDENKWDDIGYHYVIRKDGTVEPGRPLNVKGAHALGRNNWIGIVLTGYNTFTKVQILSLKKLLKDLHIKYVERHHERCPGPGLSIKELLK